MADVGLQVSFWVAACPSCPCEALFDSRLAASALPTFARSSALPQYFPHAMPATTKRARACTLAVTARPASVLHSLLVKFGNWLRFHHFMVGYYLIMPCRAPASRGTQR